MKPATLQSRIRSLSKSQEEGFTLLEMMVAVVIVGLSLAVFFQLLSASMKLEMKTRERLQELLLAEQVFDTLQDSNIRDDGFQWQGETSGYTWSLQMFLLEEEFSAPLSGDPGWQPAAELYEFVFTFQREQRVIATWRINKTYPTGYFGEDFQSRHVEVKQIAGQDLNSNPG